jgi:hypothetical protein
VSFRAFRRLPPCASASRRLNETSRRIGAKIDSEHGRFCVKSYTRRRALRIRRLTLQTLAIFAQPIVKCANPATSSGRNPASLFHKLHKSASWRVGSSVIRKIFPLVLKVSEALWERTAGSKLSFRDAQISSTVATLAVALPRAFGNEVSAAAPRLPKRFANFGNQKSKILPGAPRAGYTREDFYSSTGNAQIPPTLPEKPCIFVS